MAEDQGFMTFPCGLKCFAEGQPSSKVRSFQKLYLTPREISQAEKKKQTRTCFPEGVWDSLDPACDRFQGAPK